MGLRAILAILALCVGSSAWAEPRIDGHFANSDYGVDRRLNVMAAGQLESGETYYLVHVITKLEQCTGEISLGGPLKDGVIKAREEGENAGECALELTFGKDGVNVQENGCAKAHGDVCDFFGDYTPAVHACGFGAPNKCARYSNQSVRQCERCDKDAASCVETGENCSECENAFERCMDE